MYLLTATVFMDLYVSCLQRALMQPPHHLPACHRSMSKSIQSDHYHPHFLREMDILFSEERYSVSPV